jgi:hypothetical protein
VIRSWTRRTGPLHSGAAKMPICCTQPSHPGRTAADGPGGAHAQKSIAEREARFRAHTLAQHALPAVFSTASIFPRTRPPAPGLLVRGFDARRSSRNRMTTLIWIKGCRAHPENGHLSGDLDQRRRCEPLTSICRCDDGAAGLSRPYGPKTSSKRIAPASASRSRPVPRVRCTRTALATAPFLHCGMTSLVCQQRAAVLACLLTAGREDADTFG